MTIKVWGRRNSVNVQKVLWTLGELRLPCEFVNAGGHFGGLDAPEFRAMNPHGRVPVLADGDAVVWESNAIVRYLAARYGSGSLWVESPATRACADEWMDWTLATFQPDFLGLFANFFRTPEADRKHALIADYAARCVRHFGLLDVRLAAQPFLAGDALTMGDIPAGALLHRFFGMGYPMPDFPHVRAWYDRLALRSAYREHVMVVFEDLRGHPA